MHCIIHFNFLLSSFPYSGLSDNLIQDIIYNYLVLPNRITIPLVGDVELALLRFPMPKVLVQRENAHPALATWVGL